MTVRQVTFRCAARWKARRPRQRDTKSLFNRITAVSVAVTFAVAPVLAQAGQLPQGGSVAAGSATIGTPHNGTLDINQSSNRAVIDWHSFSVGQGNTVNFNQPSAASATLNRVTGNTPSSIAGTINAPGTVLLVNPNGIAITKSGVVNVGSFAASTLDIKNSDFMSGNYKFTGNGNSAAVTNAGRINVSDGGFAALLGGQVANDGIITARLGKVALGSGELMTLDLSGDGFLSVAIPTKDLGKIKGADGKSLITNSGKIIADGGVVELKAATAAGLLRDAVNVPGSIQANSVGVHNGRIVLGGGAGGRVRVAGRIRARGRHHANGGNVTVTGASVDVSGRISTASKHGKGGVVILTAKQVTLGHEARLDASGATGGTLLIGGDVHGGADPSADFSITPVTNALMTTIAAGATLTANGTNGQGGNIVVWSNDKTTFAGGLSVAGANGAGGFAEVSGHKLLDFTGSVDLAGTTGAGTLLLDPENVTISNGTDTGFTNGNGTYTAGADNSILSVATLQAALASGNVIVTTGGAGSAGSQAGDITVANDVTWSSGNSLTLDAYRDIDVNANITNTGGAAVTLRADNSGTGTGTVAFGAGNAISTSGTVTIYYNPAGNDATSVNTTSYKTPTDYSGNVAGGGTLASTMLVNTVFDLQNINNNLSANYALGRDIDASGTATWNSNAGFVPLGTDGAGKIWDGTGFSAYASGTSIGFNGNFNGFGHTISNLTVSTGTNDYAGLFGYSSGTVENVGLVNANVAGGDAVGALVGDDEGLVSYAFSSGSVSGGVSASATAGGLVGQIQTASGSIMRSYSTATVNSGTLVGGLLGALRNGTVSESYATGAVHGTVAGGLIAQVVDGNVSRVYATGSITWGSLGGELLASASGSTVDQSYSTGSGTYQGIIGFQDPKHPNTLSSLYGDVQTTGVIGGLKTADALKQASYTGFDFTNSWGIVEAQSYPYFLWQYPASGGTPQVISGAAYIGSGNTPAAGRTVSTFVNGASVASASVGANGYYNILVAPGTIASGSALLAYTSGANAGARVETVTGSVSAFDIWGSALIAPTVATTYSTASATPLQSQDSSLISTAVGSNTTVANLVGGLTSYGYIATGSGFTVDAPAGPGLYVSTTASGAGITVSAPITIANGNGLTLDAAGALAIDAPIKAEGNAAVVLAYDSSSATNLSFGLTAAGFTGGLTYTAANGNAISSSAGGTLAINGTPYTLLYSMTDLQNVNASGAALSGNNALATSLDASSVTGFVPLGTNSAGNIWDGTGFSGSGGGFTGTFSGLGHTISNLTVNIGANSYAGLFGYSSGTINNVGLVGGSVTGSAYVGGLAGLNTGTVSDAYSTGTVNGSFAIGGLVGYNFGSYTGGATANATISNVYATGAVSGANDDVGGLVGWNYAYTPSGGSVAGYAAISNAYATGAVSGANNVGGLVGWNVASTSSSVAGYATISNAYATGAVSSTTTAGGLVGKNSTIASSSGAANATISNAYATGAVSGASLVGGLVGKNDAQTYSSGAANITITNGYWDTETSGPSLPGIGQASTQTANGQTTAQLQGSLPTGFDNSAWGTGTGLYPYLKSFYPNGVEAVSGIAYSDAGTTPAASGASGAVNVAVAINGRQVASAFTGVNGYYYAALPAGTVTGSSGVLTYLKGGSTAGSAFTDAVSAKVAGLDIYGNTLNVRTADAKLSIVTGNLATTLGSLSSNALPFSAGTGSLTTTAGNVQIDTSASAFSVDGTVSAAGTLLVNAPNGSLTLASGGLTSAASGNAIVLADGTTFTNSIGNGALTLTGGGRFLIYSQDADNDNVGGLTAGTIYSSTYAANPPSSITATGNQFIYASAGTLIVSGYVYSDLGTTLVGSGVTVNALINGVSLGTATTGSGGQYQFSVAHNLLDGSQMLITYTTGATGGVALAENASGAISNLNIYGDALTVTTASSALSTVNSNLATAIGGVSGVPSGYANLAIDATTPSGFNIDTNVNLAGTMRLSVAGDVSGSSGNVSANRLSISTTSGASNVNLSGDVVNLGDISLGGGSFKFDNGTSDLAVGGTVIANGGVTIKTNGSLTLASGAQIASSATGNAVVLDLASNFVNNAGANAISAPTGRWIVYSASSAMTLSAISIAAIMPFSILPRTACRTTAFPTGNRYVFANQPVLTVTSTDASKTYGDVADVSSNYTITGFQGVANAFLADTAATAVAGAPSVTSGGTAAAADVGSGSYAINVDYGTLSSPNSYAFNLVSTGRLTVTQRPLVITAAAVSRTYGDANPATGTATGDNLVNGDTIAGVDLSSPATTGSNVGGYDLTGSNAAFGSGSASNYAISYATVTNGLTVTQRPLVITAAAVSRTYGDANPATGTATGDNLVNGDTIAGVDLSSPATTGSNVGGYDLTGSNAAFGSGSASNYAISYATVTNGLTVTQRPLVITAAAVSRTYGDANPATGTATGDNLVNGDTIAGVDLSSPATTGSNVGGYDLTGSNAAFGSGSASNYAISYATVTNGLTVTQRPLVITAAAVSRTYGDANPATGTATGDNLVNGDTIAGVDLSSPATTGSNVGGYDLTGSNAAFGSGSASNYAISYATVTNGLTVTQRPLVITAAAVSRTYGDANPATGTATGDNLVNGDTITGVDLSSPATTGSNVGGYDLTGSNAAFGSGSASNYAISYATVTNGLTVTQRPLVITAAAVSRTYGDANPATGTATGDNLVNGDTIAGVDLSSPATTGSNVGGYDLTGSNAAFGSGSASNYAISYATVTNGLTVTPADLTVTANNASKTYDGQAYSGGNGVSYSGFVNGEGVSVLGGSVSYGGTAQGAVNAGSYTLTASGLSSSNYTIAYVDGSLAVAKATLTLAGSKTYDGTGGFAASAFGSGGTLAGVNGETLTLTGSGSVASADVSAGTQALSLGSLILTNGTGLASNYQIAGDGQHRYDHAGGADGDGQQRVQDL